MPSLLLHRYTNMFVKLSVLACCVAAVCGVWTGPLAGGVPASQFPAGVSPQACPNYPNCNNPALSANPSAPAPYNPQPQYQQPYNAAPVPQYNGLQGALDRGEYVGDGDYHGEGLAEALAPGYAGQNGQWNNQGQQSWQQPQQQQQWNQGGQQWNQGGQQWAQPQAHGVPAQIPAGVDARSCPNYPFCHA